MVSGPVCVLGLVGILASTVTNAHALGLTDLIQEAIDTHPSVRSAQASRAGAHADLATARWQYYPTPSISIEGAATDNNPARGDATVQTYRIQQPLWQGGRLDLGVKKSEAQIMDRDAWVSAVRQQLALGVLQAFGEWYAAKLKIAAIDESLVVHRELQSQIERRIHEGLSPRSDLSLAVTRLEQVQAELTGYQSQQQIAQIRLAQLLGRSIGAEELGGVRLTDARFSQDVDGIVSQALVRDPAVLRSSAQAEVAAIEADLTAASRWPSVSAFMEHQAGAAYRGGPNRVLRAGISVQTNFGAGLSLSSSIESARARAQGAQEEVEVTRRGISDQVQSDHMQYRATLVRRAALMSALAASLNVRSSYDRQYLAGSKSWMDVMNAARELSQLTVQRGDVESTLLVLGWRLMIRSDGVNSLSGAGPGSRRGGS